ncbi:ribonuclease P Ecym_6194 [Eremothecium cymbalariae DBVPG|uniref:Ribonucleases P/MRP subunit Pop8-like domain-containing protein n=1 Tax=Eremothecium cymbalariae (strain CBS 270.75 / DBVPG 7215 / KCTC 17166 / NRRL Y-17582) TaxID=931890 RepID=G8JV98_ERECY|nr:hypothetical protein Ecym_6194 [Eremothecium cymbalariae DBVPG\
MILIMFKTAHYLIHFIYIFAMSSSCKHANDWYYFKLKLTSPNVEQDSNTHLDEMTWRQFIRHALKHSHGVFGEAIEFDFLNQDNGTAYVKVGYDDRDNFSSALSSYISSDELVGFPLVIHILQSTPNAASLHVEESDFIWLNNYIEIEKSDLECK